MAYLISTHAPAGGATSRNTAMMSQSRYFYSRPCGRGDLYPEDFLSTGELFLLTPLREGRLWAAMAVAVTYFISTHAPAGGATPARDCRTDPQSDFYSRPCGRGDCKLIRERTKKKYFYSRPCGRGDRDP